jgi:hypothetical protein
MGGDVSRRVECCHVSSRQTRRSRFVKRLVIAPKSRRRRSFEESQDYLGEIAPRGEVSFALKSRTDFGSPRPRFKSRLMRRELGVTQSERAELQEGGAVRVMEREIEVLLRADVYLS